MSDNLRTRIAKVLHGRFGPSLGAHPDGWDREPGHSREMYLEDADAVIAELGLRVEKGQRSNATGPLWGSNNRHTVTRYVTEWTPDE